MIDLVVSSTNDNYQYDTKSVKDLCTIVLKDSSYDAISLNIIFSDDNNLSRLKLKYSNFSRFKLLSSEKMIFKDIAS